MDLNERVVHFNHPMYFSENENVGDTALSLKCLGIGGSNGVRFRSCQNNLRADISDIREDGCKLVLGLGQTPSSWYYNLEVNKNNSSASGSQQELLSRGDSVLKLGLASQTLEMFSGLDSSLTSDTGVSMPCLRQVSAGNHNSRNMVPVLDEGSTSAKKFGSYVSSLLLPPGSNNSNLTMQMQEPSHPSADTTSRELQPSIEPSSHTDLSGTSGVSSHLKSNSVKNCKYSGCVKGARGATGFCIGHGGGQRCQRQGCNKGAESRTTFCKAHGGGRRCNHLGCTKSAEGKTDFCIAHGGGRRCGFPGGCTKAARGKSGLCIKHGGGKRCRVEGCMRSAEGQAGVCISHGGGRRCQYPDCNKGAQGSTVYCKAHGGGRRCIFGGCTKGAEGSTPLCKAHGGGKRCFFDGGGICPKSVHGGTNFCVAHGGGKRCVVPGCTKSARGRTDCCVKHGGGKRCRIEGCEKSAQGSTDFCKAHGGGKRCTWGGGEKCEKYARGKSGLCAAHNSIMSRDKDTNRTGLIGPGLFHGLVSASSTTTDHYSSSSGYSAASICLDSLDRPEKRQRQRQGLIPIQVLVPPSMKSSSDFRNTGKPEEKKKNESNCFGFMIPEERVHGGGLLSLLGGSFEHPID